MKNKICKVHGELKDKQYIIENLKNGTIYYRCKECKKEKELIRASKKTNCQIHGLLTKDLIKTNGTCRLCHRATAGKKRNENRAWFNEKMQKKREENPDKWDKIYKVAHQKFKAKYKSFYSLKKCCDSRGITIEQYQQIHELQKGNCSICFQPETRKGLKTNIPMRLVIDHCHKTNKFRGLICHSCNTGLGKFFDDPIRMYRAIRYIKEGGFNGHQ